MMIANFSLKCYTKPYGGVTMIFKLYLFLLGILFCSLSFNAIRAVSDGSDGIGFTPSPACAGAPPEEEPLRGRQLTLPLFRFRCGLHPLADRQQGVKILQADVHALSDVLLQMAGKVPGGYTHHRPAPDVPSVAVFALRL